MSRARARKSVEVTNWLWRSHEPPLHMVCLTLLRALRLLQQSNHALCRRQPGGAHARVRGAHRRGKLRAVVPAETLRDQHGGGGQVAAGVPQQVGDAVGEEEEEVELFALGLCGVDHGSCDLEGCGRGTRLGTTIVGLRSLARELYLPALGAINGS